MKNLKEISTKEALVINGGVAPVYDEDGNLVSTCTDVFQFPTIG